MDKKKNLGIIGGVACLFVVIILVGVVWAGFTQTLEINGSGSVKSSSWKIKFTNLSAVSLTGSAKEITAPTLTDTKIGDYAVTLEKPGDSISYTIDVKNDGTFDAEISSIDIPTPTCEGTGANATTDAANVCKNLTYTLTNSNGNTVAQGDTLVVGETKTFTLKLTYSASTEAADLPTNDVTISNLKVPIIYVQK